MVKPLSQLKNVTSEAAEAPPSQGNTTAREMCALWVKAEPPHKIIDPTTGVDGGDDGETVAVAGGEPDWIVAVFYPKLDELLALDPWQLKKIEAFIFNLAYCL